MKLTGKVSKGRIEWDSLAAYTIACREYEGRRVDVTLEPARLNRTDSQNRYYFSAVVPVFAWLITEELRKADPGVPEVSKEEAHEAMKRKFLGAVLSESGFPVVRSTTALSTGGFSDYVEKCRAFAAEKGFWIPAPGERDEVMA